MDGQGAVELLWKGASSGDDANCTGGLDGDGADTLGGNAASAISPPETTKVGSVEVMLPIERGVLPKLERVRSWLR